MSGIVTQMQPKRNEKGCLLSRALFNSNVVNVVPSQKMYYTKSFVASQAKKLLIHVENDHGSR
jgi:hypothetical protein